MHLIQTGAWLSVFLAVCDTTIREAVDWMYKIRTEDCLGIINTSLALTSGPRLGMIMGAARRGGASTLVRDKAHVGFLLL